jgi:hypothetical protein
MGWLFESQSGERSWHGEASEEAAEAVRLKLEGVDGWSSPTRKFYFAERQRTQFEAAHNEGSSVELKRRWVPGWMR